MIVLAVLTAMVFAACDAGPGPNSVSPRAPADRSQQPDPTDVIVAQLGGPWRRSPIIVDDAHVAIISDACAAAARETLGETEADLPTALVDARGEGLATAILADDLNAIECLAHLDETARTATVDSVARLAAIPVAPVDGSRITVASVVQENDRPGGRTVAFGRIGPIAEAAKVGFDDASVVLATSTAGWWAMWWRGADRASTYAAVDKGDLAIGSATSLPGQLEARVGPAAWWIDPAAAAPTGASTAIRALIHEEACASGKTPKDRVEPPTIELTDATITVTFAIRKQPGDQDCQGNAPFPLTITLPEPLGQRSLLDGSVSPPRDATKVPAL